MTKEFNNTHYRIKSGKCLCKKCGTSFKWRLGSNKAFDKIENKCGKNVCLDEYVNDDKRIIIVMCPNCKFRFDVL